MKLNDGVTDLKGRAFVASAGLAVAAAMPITTSGLAHQSTTQREPQSATSGTRLTSEPPSTSSSVSYGLPESRPGGIALPSGFDPLEATNDELEANGLPPRPSDPPPSWWVDMVTAKDIRTFDSGVSMGATTVAQTNVGTAGSMASSGVTPQSAPAGQVRISRNWSGYGEAKALSGHSYNYASANWYVPAVSQYAADNGQSWLSTWVGLGGVNGDQLIQEGSSGVVDDNGNPFYFCWWETPGLPGASGAMQGFTDLTCNPGDHVTAVTSTYYGDYAQHFAIMAVTNNDTSTTRTQVVNVSSVVVGRTAEYINERVYSDGVFRNLPQFNGFAFHNAQYQFEDVIGLRGLHATTPSYKWYMVGCRGSNNKDVCEGQTPSGSVIGHAGNTISSTDSFSVFRDSNPSLQ